MNYFVLFILLVTVPWTKSQEPSVESVNETRRNSIGAEVLFPCKVDNLGNNTVVWSYLDHDLTISNNLKVLINSDRYSVEQPQVSGGTGGASIQIFSLVIRDLTHSDQGQYVCSVEGGTGTATYQLNIIEAVIPILPVNVSHANQTECCLKEQVSPACLPVCDQGDPNYQSIGPSACDADVLKLIKCGTDGRNHINCCRRRQIPVHCLEICSSSSATIGKEQYSCELSFNQIHLCYNEGQVTLPTPPREVSAVGILNGFSVEWLEPEENANLVTGYRVFYKSITSPLFQSTEVLGDDSRSSVISVSSGREYLVYVIAISLHGTSQPSSQIQLYSIPKSDPNSAQNKAIKGCCVAAQVNQICEMALCKSDVYRALFTRFLKFCENDLPQIFHCISGGQDHSNCCRGKGLPEDCMGLCTGQVIPFNETLVPCLTQLHTIESCLEEGFPSLPSSPPRVRVESVGSTSAMIEWDPAFAGVHPADNYIVRYKMRTDKGQTQTSQVLTGGLFAELISLRPDTVYEATVTSTYLYSSSLASPTLIFQTYSESDISSNPPSLGSDVAPVHPDMAACCAGKGVNAECLWICSYSLDFHYTLQHNRTALQRCSPHISEMLTCGSDNRNHTSCCETSLIPEQCLFMCAVKHNDSLANLPAVCQQNSGGILNCYASGVVSIPLSPDNVTLTNYTSRTITLKWDAPASGPLVTEYIIQYRRGSILDQTPLAKIFWQEDRTNRTVHILQNLRTESRYTIGVISANENGTSITRDYIIQMTLSEGSSLTPAIPGTTEDPIYANPEHPHVNRSECCSQEGLSGTCLSDCENGYALNTTCSQHIFSMLICAADGANHRPCCKNNGVSNQCLGLCEGGQMASVTPVEVYCGSYVNQIMFCLQRKSVAIPSQPTNVRIREISSRTARVLWDPPMQNGDSVTYNFYYARFKRNFMTKPVKLTGIASPLMVTGLLKGSLYQMYLIAENRYGVSQTSSKHVIKTQGEAPLEVTIDQNPRGIIGLGEAVSLMCRYTAGAPRPIVYEWFLNAHTVHLGRGFDIANVSRKDEGLYTCRIKNALYDSAKYSRYLPLRYKPEVIYVSGDTVVPNVGYTGLLTCMFKGHPLRIEWKKDNEPLDSQRILSKRSRDFLSNGTTVALLEVGLIEEQDFGNYTCRAINTFGFAEAKSKLENALIPVPIIPTLPVDSTNLDMMACCRRLGVLSSCMTWCSVNMNHERLMNSVSHGPCQNSIYLIMECMADRRDSTKCCQKSRVQDICLPLCSGAPIDPQEMENTYCLSSSKRIFQCFNISQKHVPTPPEQLIVLKPPVKGRLSVAWRRPLKKPFELTFYHIFYGRVGDHRNMISLASTFLSETIQLGKNGVFHIWMVAGNSNGQSVKSNILTVTVKDVFPNAPEDLHGQSLTPYSISLSWNHPDYRKTHIDNYNIYYRRAKQIEYNNVSTNGLISSYILENLLPRTEYEVFLKGNNFYGEGDKSVTIYVDTIDEEAVSTGHEGASFSPVGLGVGLAVVLILLIILIIISVYFYRLRHPSLKQPGAVSFENPSYYETNNPVQISGLRNDVPDSGVQTSASNGGNSYVYDQPSDPPKEAFPDHDYATLDVAQTNSHGTNHVTASANQSQSSA